MYKKQVKAPTKKPMKEEEIKSYIEQKVRTEFTQLKSENDRKWNEFTEQILERMKPPVSLSQALNWLFSFITVLAFIIGFVLLIRFDVNQNIKTTEEVKIQMEKILILSTATNNAVIELKTKSDVEKQVQDRQNKSQEQYDKTKNFFNQKK